MRGNPLRFSPAPWQLTALDALAGAAAVSLAMALRFVDEGSVPATYGQRLLAWIFLAAAVEIAAGEVMNRLRKPGSMLARRPVVRFASATAARSSPYAPARAALLGWAPAFVFTKPPACGRLTGD